MKSKVHLGKERRVSAELLLRLVGIYWISSVTKMRDEPHCLSPSGQSGRGRPVNQSRASIGPFTSPPGIKSLPLTALRHLMHRGHKNGHPLILPFCLSVCL